MFTHDRIGSLLLIVTLDAHLQSELHRNLDLTFAVNPLINRRHPKLAAVSDMLI